MIKIPRKNTQLQDRSKIWVFSTRHKPEPIKNPENKGFFSNGNKGVVEISCEKVKEA